jgi:hypothetical protein
MPKITEVNEPLGSTIGEIKIVKSLQSVRGQPADGESPFDNRFLAPRVEGQLGKE